MQLPTNPLVKAMLMDKYQMTTGYANFNNDKHNQYGVFNHLFRKYPFNGGFVIYSGVEEVLRFVENFHITGADIDYLREGNRQTLEEQLLELQIAESFGQVKFLDSATYSQQNFRYNRFGAYEEHWTTCRMPVDDIIFTPGLPNCSPEFYDWLAGIDTRDVKIRAMREGSFAFAQEPLMQVEGPLAICQLLETTLLNLTNFPSLATTKALRFRLAAGGDKDLLEFGARRAQGPDGAITVARSAYLGGFDSTSNMEAGQLFNIPVSGTMPHAFIEGFESLDELRTARLRDISGEEREFVQVVLRYRKELGFDYSNEGELASFIAYAQAFPSAFLALVDTYDTLASGVPNYLCVALALREFGYNALGNRLDSGDLAILSEATRSMLRQTEEKYPAPRPGSLLPLDRAKIVSGNDLTEKIVKSLRDQGDESDSHGIGTKMATCYDDPALGGVYKLVAQGKTKVEVTPRLKLTNDRTKTPISGLKGGLFRLYGENGSPLLDLVTLEGEPTPEIGKVLSCRDPYDESVREDVIPHLAEEILPPVWEGKRTGPEIPVKISRKFVFQQLAKMPKAYLRPEFPETYKVRVSEPLSQEFRGLIARKTVRKVLK